MKYRSQSVHKFEKNNDNYIATTLRQQSSQATGPGCYNSNPETEMKKSPQYSIGKT